MDLLTALPKCSRAGAHKPITTYLIKTLTPVTYFSRRSQITAVSRDSSLLNHDPQDLSRDSLNSFKKKNGTLMEDIFIG